MGGPAGPETATTHMGGADCVATGAGRIHGARRTARGARPKLARAIRRTEPIEAAPMPGAATAFRGLCFTLLFVAPVADAIVLARVNIAAHRFVVVTARGQRRGTDQDERDASRRFARTGGHDRCAAS